VAERRVAAEDLAVAAEDLAVAAEDLAVAGVGNRRFVRFLPAC
jgi:hypothetical protein